ncbi:MAG: SH3 domain-containing protein [Planctomycetota bacterium]
MGLAVDPEGYVYISQSPGRKHPRARISEFSPSLRWMRDIFFAGFEGADGFQPNNMAINKAGTLYVTGSGFPGVVVLNSDGTFSHLLSPTDSLGKGEEEKATICDVEIDNAGMIYLLSEDMGRVYVYDDKETYLFKFGKKGGSSGKLSRPRGLAVDSSNKGIYVIDYMRHTATAYSDKGRFLFEFGGKGWGTGWFQYPSDIAVDTAGNVLVADTFNNRVQVLAMREIPSVGKVEEVKPRAVGTKEPRMHKPTKFYVLTANMNLRKKGSTESKIIKLMRKGEAFEIIDQHKDDDLTSWYYIRTGSGLEGWFCGIYRGKVKFAEKVGE